MHLLWAIGAPGIRYTLRGDPCRIHRFELCPKAPRRYIAHTGGPFTGDCLIITFGPLATCNFSEGFWGVTMARHTAPSRKLSRGCRYDPNLLETHPQTHFDGRAFALNVNTWIHKVLAVIRLQSWIQGPESLRPAAEIPAKMRGRTRATRRVATWILECLSCILSWSPLHVLPENWSELEQRARKRL